MISPEETGRFPRPVADDDSEPFWAALKQHRLTLQLCPQGHYRFPPQPTCPYCQSLDSKWVDVSGEGTVYSFTVVHIGAQPQDGTYAVALVELIEGPRLVMQLEPSSQPALRVGARTSIRWRDLPDFTLPLALVVG